MKARLIALILCACLLAGSLAAGCGGGGTAQLGAPDLFNAARDKMKAANSFRMTVTVKDDSTGGEGSELFGEPFDGDTYAEFIFEKTGEGQGICRLQVENHGCAYLTQEGEYREIDGKWHFKRAKGSDSAEQRLLADPLGTLDPQSFMDMMDLPGEVLAVEESDSFMRYRFVLDPDELLQNPSPQELKFMAEQMELPESEVRGFFEEMRQSYKDAFTILLTVDKKNELISEAIMFVYLDMTPIMQLFDDAGIGGLDSTEMVMKVEMFATFSDYGKDFGLELPEEAKAARSKRK